MAITSIDGNSAIQNAIIDSYNTSKVEKDNKVAFDSLFDSAIDMYRTADELQKAAEESEINFALGYATSTHDLAIAQQKASIALQYSVKVTNKALEAYKELMNMQI